MARLRITGGAARGRSIDAPAHRGVRPTSSRVREAVFSIVGQNLTGVRFVDVCAGSGIMSAEAWSRGAQVTAFERDRRAAAAIRAQLAALGAQVTVHNRDGTRIREGDWDIAFVDPPYALDPMPFLVALECRAKTVHIEVESRRTPIERVGELILTRTRRFGDTTLWTFVHGGDPAESAR